MRLSVITPTRGRLSLRKTLASIQPQLCAGDEHIVIGDGPQVAARALALEFGATYYQGPATGLWGNAQRDYGLRKASGTFAMFCDDDDIFLPDALANARNVIVNQALNSPILFRMDVPGIGIAWHERGIIAVGNVGTPMIVVPIDNRLATWADSENQYCADYWFISNTIKNHGDCVLWCDEVICLCRMQQRNSIH